MANKLDGLYSVPWINSEGTSCIRCKHYIADGCCKAFKDGIPEKIWLGTIVHSNPFDNDHGIMFEKVESIESAQVDDEQNIFNKPISKRR